jgi:hypothetical protein
VFSYLPNKNIHRPTGGVDMKPTGGHRAGVHVPPHYDPPYPSLNLDKPQERFNFFHTTEEK